MSRPLIVLADTDEKYLSTLEEKFLREIDDNVDLEIISQKDYFDIYFSTPRTIEIAAIDESIYSSELKKHNINNIFILTEELTRGTEELSVTYIHKYTGIRQIFNELIHRSREILFVDERFEKETKVISLYSAVGGCGKTSIGLGLANYLSENHRRVLYINTESIQSFSFYLNNKKEMPSEGYKVIKNYKDNIYQNIKQFLREENFSYLPPFMATLDALNLDYAIYTNLLEGVKESKDYDFIIIDIESGYSVEKTQLLQRSDKVLIIMEQDLLSVYKTEYLLRNIDLRDKEKYMFICNKYQEDKKNNFIESKMQEKHIINEYVNFIREPIEDIKQLSNLDGIKKIAYMFI